MQLKINKDELAKIQQGLLGDNLFGNASVSPQSLIAEITNGPPASYLLSGYRGAGKTTYIHVIEELAASSANTIVIHVDFSRYVDNPKLFRWLIRRLYEGVRDHQHRGLRENMPKPKTVDKETMRQLNNLHVRTFAEFNQTYAVSHSLKHSIETTIDLVKYVTFIGYPLSILLQALNLHYKWVSESTGLVIGNLVPIVTGVGSWLALKATRTRTESEQTDQSLKVLFDDEIADHRFLELLQLLSGEGFKLLFIFDEMDKVEESRLESLLISLKPYLLCGYASFIVVAGQQLYYKYRLTRTQNDAILASLFSRIIHISLLSRAQLRQLFNRVTEGSELEYLEPPAKHLIDRYIRHLIFDSRQIPRQFLQLIRQSISWTADGTGMLNIPGHLPDKEHRVLEIADGLAEQEIESQAFDAGERDYLLTELLITCTHLLHTEEEAVTLESLYPGPDNDYLAEASGEFYRVLLPVLRRIALRLLEACETEGVITADAEKSYRLTSGDPGSIRAEVPDEEDVIPLNQLNELKLLVNVISEKLSIGMQAAANPRRFSQQLDEFASRGAFSASFLRNQEARQVLDSADELMKSRESRDKLRNALAKYQIEPNRLTPSLLEFFCKSRSAQILDRHGYHAVETTDDPAIDFTLISRACWKQRVHFDVKLRRGNLRGDRRLWQDAMLRAQDLDEREYLIVVVFTDNLNLEREAIQMEFADLARDSRDGSEWQEKIQLILVDKNDFNALDAGLDLFVQRQIVRQFTHNFNSQIAPPNHPERNDDEYPELIDFRKYDVHVKIIPDQTDYWRFGFRLLPDQSRPSRNQGRHSDKGIGDIDVCVGEAHKEHHGRHVWSNPDQLDLSFHNIKTLNNGSPTRLHYQPDPIAVEFVFNHANENAKVTVIHSRTNERIERLFDLRRYKCVLLAAWCDDREFHLATTITITRYVPLQ